MYTDASDTFWSNIVTEVPRDDVIKAWDEQHHSPLASLSGRFDKMQLCCSNIEKEAYTVMATVNRMNWLLADRQGFDLYTDHNNHIYIFDPTSFIADISQTTPRKDLRWAVRRSAYNYTCIHICGTNSVWADMLGRWSVQPLSIRRLDHILALCSSSSEEFVWPTGAELRSAQGTVPTKKASPAFSQWQ